jgi:hypothetical protein
MMVNMGYKGRRTITSDAVPTIHAVLTPHGNGKGEATSPTTEPPVKRRYLCC